jgi:hypothetical protein
MAPMMKDIQPPPGWTPVKCASVAFLYLLQFCTQCRNIHGLGRNQGTPRVRMPRDRPGQVNLQKDNRHD